MKPVSIIGMGMGGVVKLVIYAFSGYAASGPEAELVKEA